MDQQTNDTTAAERRTETRYDTGDTAQIFALEDEVACQGKVMDVSRSGLRLRTVSCLPVQRLITVRVGDVTVAGRVRYCTKNADGTFDAGVLISDLDYDGQLTALLFCNQAIQSSAADSEELRGLGPVPVEVL
jgi:hypothetical protein